MFYLPKKWTNLLKVYYNTIVKRDVLVDTRWFIFLSKPQLYNII